MAQSASIRDSGSQTEEPYMLLEYRFLHMRYKLDITEIHTENKEN